MRATGLGALPPTLLVTAEHDPLRDEGIAYAGKLREAGVPVAYHHFDNAEHGFACTGGPGPDFRRLLEQINSWLAQLN